MWVSNDITMLSGPVMVSKSLRCGLKYQIDRANRPCPLALLWERERERKEREEREGGRGGREGGKK